MQIGEADLLTVRDLKAPIHSSRLRPCRDGRLGRPARAKLSGLGARRPAPPRIHWLIIAVIRRPRRLRHILPRACTRINQSLLTQRFPRRQIVLSPLALRVRAKRPSAVWPLGPRNPKPAQVLDHRFHKFRSAPLRIEVLIAEDQLSAAFLGPLCGNPKCPRMSQVQKPSRRRREPPAIGMQGIS